MKDQLNFCRIQTHDVVERDRYTPDFHTQLLVDGSKRAIYTSDEFLQSFIKSSDGKFKYLKLKERIVSDHISYIFERNYFMFEAYNRKILQLVESGIAAKIIQGYNQKTGELAEDGPAVLTLEHLSVGFEIWLLFLLVSSVCFLFEFVQKIYAMIVSKLLVAPEII